LRGIVKSDDVRKAVIVASENLLGLGKIEAQLTKVTHLPPEEDYGGGDFVSPQEEPSTVDEPP